MNILLSTAVSVDIAFVASYAGIDMFKAYSKSLSAQCALPIKQDIKPSVFDFPQGK
jgi:hypothetical protein